MILVVEDDPEWQEKFCSTLSDLGYDYRLAASFEVGLKELGQQRPLALLLDLKVPSSAIGSGEFHGWKLAQQAVVRDVPTIIVTAYPTLNRARIAFRKYRVVDFLDKATLSKRSLAKSVSDAVEESRRRRLEYHEKEDLLVEMQKVFLEVLSSSGFRRVEFTSPDQYDIAAIRTLIQDSFTVEEISRFCKDHSIFRSLAARFAPAHSLEDRTDIVIEFCEKRDLFSELLSAMREFNPRQYERHYARVFGSGSET